MLGGNNGDVECKTDEAGFIKLGSFSQLSI